MGRARRVGALVGWRTSGSLKIDVTPAHSRHVHGFMATTQGPTHDQAPWCDVPALDADGRALSRAGLGQTPSAAGLAVERRHAQDLMDRLHRAENEYYAGGDVRRLETLLTPDVCWSVLSDKRLAGVYNGIAEVLDYMGRRRRLAGCTLRLVRRDVLMGRGSRIAALTDAVAVRCGSMYTWRTLGIYDVQGRRIRRCWLVPLDVCTFDELWP